MSFSAETARAVWNRALDLDEPAGPAGDAALHTLLVFHGLAINGGLYHAVEAHRVDENYPIDAVTQAYRFFDLEVAADAIEHAVTEQEELDADENDDVDDDTIDEATERIDDSYRLEDGDLEDALTMVLQRDPDAFAPID